jgi:AcrR family transcriptional regulator
MRTATELKAIILQEATVLFTHQGYKATSIKQIAQAAGCTTAALYYYFEDGKAQILHEVLNALAEDLAQSFVQMTGQAQSFHEVLELLGQTIAQTLPPLQGRVKWLLFEFPNFTDEEKAFIRKQLLTMQQDIQKHLAPFVPDDRRAFRLAWILFCAYFGYENFFMSMEVDNQRNLRLEEFAMELADTLSPEA